MAIPVAVTLDRGDQGSLDLTPLLEPGSLTWSSVVPGGFASCSFQVNGDFRRLVKQFPYLSIVRVVGDSGRVLFEGQIEDLAPTLTDQTVGVRIGAFGLQNALKEQSVRQIWSKRDLNWTQYVTSATDTALDLTIGQFDNTDLTRIGIQVQGNGGTTRISSWQVARYILPVGLSLVQYIAGLTVAGNPGIFAVAYTYNTAGTLNRDYYSSVNLADADATITPGGTGTPAQVLMGSFQASSWTSSTSDYVQWDRIRLLGVLTSEDTAGGFYGGTLINSLLGYVAPVGAGVIESGSDFVIDHLDASVRRSAYDILGEIASYYAREWAVWENALLDWKTPNLGQHQWQIPLSVLTALDLDASVQNSQQQSIVLYTDAASGITAEASATTTDRRNPYVLHGRAKDELDPQSFVMTSTTAAQLASTILNNIGFGPVPAAGSISLPGETIVGHASGAARKAWEIRAGDNVTIPELPMADIFTQDGRGEVLFHVVSAEASSSDGSVTLSLDSYGSKRSDVLLARLAAVTKALGG